MSRNTINLFGYQIGAVIYWCFEPSILQRHLSVWCFFCWIHESQDGKQRPQVWDPMHCLRSGPGRQSNWRRMVALHLRFVPWLSNVEHMFIGFMFRVAFLVALHSEFLHVNFANLWLFDWSREEDAAHLFPSEIGLFWVWPENKIMGISIVSLYFLEQLNPTNCLVVPASKWGVLCNDYCIDSGFQLDNDSLW